MNSNARLNLSCHIAGKAKALGASLAGIASAAALRNSPSHVESGGTEWPAEARSVLVLAVVHDPSEPQLDWWSSGPGGTPGNLQLMQTANGLRDWLAEDLNITAHPLPYQVAQGGVFLKDAAALAGLGIIGRNNLLITPEYGPDVRLRALFLEEDLEPTLPAGPAEFAPCEACEMPCRRACPQNAFAEDVYSRPACNVQMREDEASREALEVASTSGPAIEVVKYCRACELACPVTERSRAAASR